MDEKKISVPGITFTGDIHIQGDMFNIHDNQNVTVSVGGQKPVADYTDEKIAKAIVAINGKGKPLNSKQRWAGVHWVLRWVCNYPAKPQDFCDRVAQLPLPEDLEFKCDCRNIRELSTLSFINQDPREMNQVKPSKNDEQVFFQLREVALALMKELQK